MQCVLCQKAGGTSMRKMTLRLADVLINLVIPTPEFDAQLINKVCYWLYTFCPGLNIDMEEADYFEVYLSVVCKNSVTPCINRYNNVVFLYDYWQQRKEAIAFLAKYIAQLFEAALQKQGKYILHATAVSVQQKGVIFIGDVWQGKTVSALMSKLLIENAKLVSANRILVEDTKIVGASPVFSIPQIMLDQYPQCTSLFSSVSQFNDRRCYKTDVAPLPIIMCQMVIPYIDNGLFDISRLCLEDAIWYLFEKASSSIRGNTILFGFKEPAPNEDSEDISRKRLNYIRKLCKEIPIYRVRGTPNQIAKSVSDIMVEN